MLCFHYIDPHVPYRLDALLMTNGRGTGMISSDVFFTEEGGMQWWTIDIHNLLIIVPTAYPSMSSAVRLGPNEGRLSWSPLNLWDSKGVVRNYTISFAQSSSNETCGNTVNTKTIVIVSSSKTQGLSHSLANLKVQSPYCIKIQASTSSGPGPFSPSVLLPSELWIIIILYYYYFILIFVAYASSQICVLLSGVYNCSKWIVS